MENPLGVILLVVAGIAYKIYESCKEEQAKAKQRAENLKPRLPEGSGRDIVGTKPTRAVPARLPSTLYVRADAFPESQSPRAAGRIGSSVAQTGIRPIVSRERVVSLE